MARILLAPVFTLLCMYRVKIWDLGSDVLLRLDCIIVWKVRQKQFNIEFLLIVCRKNSDGDFIDW